MNVPRPRRDDRLGRSSGLGWLAGLALRGGALGAASVLARRRLRKPHLGIARTAWVAAPPERVFAVVADPRKPFLTGNPIVSMQVVSEQTEGVGTVYRWRFHLPFVGPFGFDEVVTAWEPGRRFAYRALTDWEMTAESRMEPEAGGTRVTFTLDYRLPGVWALVPRWLEQWAIDRALASIARRAEGRTSGWFRVLAWEGEIEAAPE